MQHVMPQAVVTDGKDHPEQIPDLIAYRLFFVASSVPPNANQKDSLRQQSQLKKLPLADADLQAFVAEMADFSQTYGDLIQNYNDSVQFAVSKNNTPDGDSFLQRRDLLVRAAVDQLRVALSPEGFSRLEATIQAEKFYMKIAR